MWKLIVGRIGQGMVTVIAISVLIFVLTQMLSGDVASAVLGHYAMPDTLAAFRKELGLSAPAHERYVNWLWGAMRGDLGISMTNQRIIIDVLLPRLKNTLFLAGYAALLAIPLSVCLGVLAAINEGKLIDKASNVLTLITISIPEFLIGYLMIILFVVNLEWFPSLATVYPGMTFGERVYITTLPAVALTLLVAAHMLRMTRNSVLSVMSSPYIETAILKGAKRRRVISRHALPNAAAPIVTVVALNMAYLVVGVVVLENVFVYPGIGQLMVDAVTKRDVPVIQACGLVFGIVFVVLNMLADVAIILVNPRLRHWR